MLFQHQPHQPKKSSGRPQVQAQGLTQILLTACILAAVLCILATLLVAFQPQITQFFNDVRTFGGIFSQ